MNVFCGMSIVCKRSCAGARQSCRNARTTFALDVGDLSAGALRAAALRAGPFVIAMIFSAQTAPASGQARSNTADRTPASASASASASVAKVRPGDRSRDKNVVAIGADIYPAITTATNQPRFDPSSTILVNTIGAHTGLFGAASREGLTWANQYVPGTDVSGRVQLYSLSTSGNYGAFFGSRSSDNTSLQPQNIIADISLVVADSDRPHLHWARYSEGFVPRGKRGFRLLINDENSIQNESDPAPMADPYDFNPSHLLNNLRLDCGIGVEGAKSCTNPLSILNNGARYRTGIIFGDNSIDPLSGLSTAISLPTNYGFSWYGGAGNPTWHLYSTARSANSGKVVLEDGAVVVNVGNSVEPALRVEKGAIHTPVVIASGSLPAISGKCPVRDRRGGSAAGSFAFTGDCSEGTLVMQFPAPAPNGWACFASNMQRPNATLREVSFTRSSVTLAVAHAIKSDSVVYSCTGF